MQLHWVSVMWAIAAIVLICAEMVIPGAFLLWLGLAAAAVFAVTLLFSGIGLLWQALLMIIFSYVSVQIYRRYFRGRTIHTDQPLLNQRAEQFIGQTLNLQKDIVNGRGQAQIGDALWTLVCDHDWPAGTRVKVVGIDGGMSLRVEAA